MSATYIVTIERNADRARRAQRAMADLGVEAALYMGVDGGAGAPIRYSTGEGYSRSLNRIHYDRPLSGPVIGCYLSHHRLWHHALESGHERIVVFEDDVLPLSNFAGALSRLAVADGRHEYIDLAPYQREYFAPAVADILEAYFRTGVDVGEGVRLLPATGSPLGTYAYSVSRSGLRKLCDGRMMPIKQPVDMALLDQTINGTLKRYITMPGIVTVSPAGTNVIKHASPKFHPFLRRRWRLFSRVFRRADLQRYHDNRKAFKRRLAEYTATRVRDLKAGVHD